MPSGNVRIGDLNRIAATNAVLGAQPAGAGGRAGPRRAAAPAVYLRDIGTVENGTDIVTGYAHVNGQRTVYIPVTKRSDASHAGRDRSACAPRCRACRRVVPEDVDIRLEFDQSRYVRARHPQPGHRRRCSARVLTGLMVLLFLRDWRSALIVVTTIPFALLAAVVCLWAVGPDHQHHDAGRPGARRGRAGGRGDRRDREHPHPHGARARPARRAVLDASRKTAVPRLLAMLCVLAVFVPSFFMAGRGAAAVRAAVAGGGLRDGRRPTCCRARWCRCCPPGSCVRRPHARRHGWTR